MITFCFILAQGGCENQLRGHTAGNFNVGNGKEKMCIRDRFNIKKYYDEK